MNKYTLKQKVNYKKIGDITTKHFEGQQWDKNMEETYICKECHSEKAETIGSSEEQFVYCSECDIDTELIERYQCCCCGFTTLDHKHWHTCNKAFPPTIRTQNKIAFLTRLWNEKNNPNWEIELQAYIKAYKASRLTTSLVDKGSLHGLYVEEDNLASERDSSFSDITTKRILRESGK